MTITNNVASKLAVAFVATAMLLTLAFAPVANAQSDAELQAQITALLAQIAALQGQTSSSSVVTQTSYTFTRDLTVGSTGEDVRQLQMFLNRNGYTVALSGAGSVGMESTYFGPLTRAAVASYQSAKGIVPAVGYFGPITRSTVNAQMASTVSTSTSTTTTTTVDPSLPAGCSSTAGFSPLTGVSCSSGATTTTTTTTTTSGTLSGGAGSVDSYELTSGYSNEEVGEDSEDVIVAGLDIENSDGSDIRLTAVKLVFDEGTAASDFDNYASEVSIWLGSDEVARVDADEFNDDNNWTKTISLDDSAVIDSDETDSLFVAISGVSNLDTADAGDTWTVDFTSVRFVDADGSSISEDPGVAVTTFTFESFATASDTVLKITEGDEDVNDSHVIDIDATDDTDNVPILSFNIEIEGDSDVNIDSLPVTLTATEATGNDVADLISTLYLLADGDEIASESVSETAPDDTQVVVFDDIDYDMEAGEEVEFTVRAKFLSIADALDAGDTIQATFGETETDLATFDAEDETGENLADADKQGTVTGETHTVYDISFTFELISTDADAQQSGFSADDSGIFTFVFELTAFGGPVNIDKSCEEGGADAADQGIEYIISNPTLNATTCQFNSTADTATADADAWTIQDGTTEEFTLTVAVGTLDAGQQIDKVYLESINWDDDIADASPDLFFTAGLGTDKTSTDTILLTGV